MSTILQQKNLDNQPLYRETQKSGQKRLPLD